MITEAEIREQLANYLAGEWSLDSFDEWFTGATWNVHQQGDEAARRLAYAIELRLAEHSSGHMTDDELSQELSVLLAVYSAKVALDAEPSPMIETAATVTPTPTLVAA